MAKAGASREELEQLLDRVDALLAGVEGEPPEREELEEALARAEGGVKRARRAGEDRLEAELRLLAGSARAQLGDPRGALACFEAALALDPGLLDARLERAYALFDLCRLGEARAAFEEVERLDPDDAAAQQGLGLLAERRGDTAEAERRFRRARHLAPDDYPPPVQLSAADFDRAVEDALLELPEGVRAWLANVAITVEPLPADADLEGAEPPLPPSILGLFRGAPLGDKASMDPWSHFPSSIALYQRNLERAARSRRELIEQVRVTLLHEVGHFLGLDEEELYERGLD
jgi:predicted Zn-dependent protease with MMP-like domain